MQLDIYQVDAFTQETFGGNPAAVCPLTEWLPDSLLQNIAAENNLAETAFFIPKGDGYHLRWFTPAIEVELCGHATLATAYVIFNFIKPDLNRIVFDSLSGPLIVSRKPDGLIMDFPVWDLKKAPAPDVLIDAFGVTPTEFYLSVDALAVFDDPEIIFNLKPNRHLLNSYQETRGVIVTAPGIKNYDFISRAFFECIAVPEDPVTGSAHCALTPYWAKRLGKPRMLARQVSARGGDLTCELKGSRVEITGQASLYMKGEIYV